MKRIFTIVLILFSFSLSAQISPYLEKGISGSGLAAGYETGKGFNGLYGKMSYSLKGKIDLNVCLYQGYFNENMEELTNPNATEFYYSGNLSWWFLREKLLSDIDVNVALTVGYESSDYTNYTLADGEYKGYYGGWGGINFNVGFNLPKNWAVQAILVNEFGFGYDEYLESESALIKPYYGVVNHLGASLIKKMNNNNSIVLTYLQSVATYSDACYFDLTLGYVFSLN